MPRGLDDLGLAESEWQEFGLGLFTLNRDELPVLKIECGWRVGRERYQLGDLILREFACWATWQ